MRKTHRSRFRVFICYFFPFIFIAIVFGVFDVFTSSLYIFEHFYSYNVDGLMRLMEISNVDQIRPLFERIDFSTRILPSLIIFATTSKFIVLLVFQFFMIFKLPGAAWNVCTVNQHYELHVEDQRTIEDYLDDAPPPLTASTSAEPTVGHESHF